MVDYPCRDPRLALSDGVADLVSRSSLLEKTSQVGFEPRAIEIEPTCAAQLLPY